MLILITLFISNDIIIQKDKPYFNYLHNYLSTDVAGKTFGCFTLYCLYTSVYRLSTHLFLQLYVYWHILLTIFSLSKGEEEAVPAKKTKTIVSTAQISQTRQARIEKVYFSKTRNVSLQCG